MATGDFKKSGFIRGLVTLDNNMVAVKLMAVDTEITGEDIQIACDAEGRLISSAAYTGDLTVTMGDVERLLAKNYWKDELTDYADYDTIYTGRSTTHKASTAAGNLWFIEKLTFAGRNRVRTEGPLVGNWDDRTSLAWA